MKTVSKFGAFVVASVVVAAASTACGGSSTPTRSSASKAVGAAFTGAFAQPGISATLSVAISASEAQALSANKKAGISAAQAAALASTSLNVDIYNPSGNLNAALGSQAAYNNAEESATLSVNGEMPVQIRQVGQTVYIQVQIKKLLTAYGEPTATINSVLSTIARAGSVQGVTAFQNGGWISVSEAQLQSLGSTISSALGGGSVSSSTPNPAAIKKFVSDFSNTLLTDGTYTAGATTGGRTEYTVVIPAKKVAGDVVNDLFKDLSSSVGGLGAAKSTLDKDVNQIKANQTVKVLVYVENGKVVETDLDLNQFSNTFGTSVPLRMVFAAGSAVTAPTPATALNVSGLVSFLGSLALGGGSTSSTTTHAGAGATTTTTTHAGATTTTKP